MRCGLARGLMKAVVACCDRLGTAQLMTNQRAMQRYCGFFQRLHELMLKETFTGGAGGVEVDPGCRELVEMGQWLRAEQAGGGGAQALRTPANSATIRNHCPISTSSPHPWSTSTPPIPLVNISSSMSSWKSWKKTQ